MEKKLKIAVIGSGISGLGCAIALQNDNSVKLFEKDKRLGGHSNTVHVDFGGKSVAVDTGFIVYNTSNYPNLVGLFDELNVPTKWSNMSFGFSSNAGKMEYACASLDTIFAQRRNFYNLYFMRGLLDILRFNRQGLNMGEKDLPDDMSLGSFLTSYNYRGWIVENFVIPMGAAIWSTPTSKILQFPARNFISFFKNHDLFNGLSNAKRWRTVDGGSTEYVSRVRKTLGNNVICRKEVVSVERQEGAVNVYFKEGMPEKFDHVVFCTHGPQAYNLLKNKSKLEEELLSHFRTSTNRVVLHSDSSLMPKKAKVWSSWNFISSTFDTIIEKPPSVTYWMNKLQGIDPNYPLFVSLNPVEEPLKNLTHKELTYSHPFFDVDTFLIQKRMDNIQGSGGVWYAGAWLGYGFHEDGLVSGLRVAAALGSKPVWSQEIQSFG